MSAAAIANVPDDLRECSQWVLWRYLRDTKVPFQTNGRCAKSTDPATWCSFDVAAGAYTKYPDYWAGIGFVFHESDPFCGIDLDDCIADGEIKAWAYPILERFHDTYAEVSPSRTGIKLWCRAKIDRALKTGIEDGGIEIYDRARFFTITGLVLRGEALPIEEHQSDVDWLLSLDGARNRVPHRLGREIKHGDRHFTLVSIGGTLARRGITGNELAALFIEMRKRFTGPPVATQNLVSLAHDLVRRYGHGN